MILVFDLDDTLYDELSYVRSGFAVVARYIERLHGVSQKEVLSRLDGQLQLGRSRIFDAVFESFGIYTKKLVRRCVSLYRLHQPKIELYPEAARSLVRFRERPIYIVTDGNTNAQKNKLVALGLYNRRPVRRCYLTYRHGRKNSKPSPYCFRKIAEREGVEPSEVVYIADNPQKDFVGIKTLGFKTVRVMTGQHRNVRKDQEHEADYKIHSLDELTEEYLQDVFIGFEFVKTRPAINIR